MKSAWTHACEEMYRKGMSIPEIADVIGWSRSSVRRKLLSMGVALRSRSEGISLARPRIAESQKGGTRPPRTIEHRRKLAEANRARPARGFTIKPSGYAEYTRGQNAGRRINRVVLETRLGSKLNMNEIAHHDDENKLNNDDDNIVYMTASEHARHHALKNLPNRKRGAQGRFL